MTEWVKQVACVAKNTHFFRAFFTFFFRYFMLHVSVLRTSLHSVLNDTQMIAVWRSHFGKISQWSSGLKRGSAVDRLLGLRVQIPPRTCVSVSCECCVSSGRDLCDWPIPHPEEFYRLWCVTMCDLETLRMRRPWPALGCSTRKKNR
jgi:hypothetical protein